MWNVAHDALCLIGIFTASRREWKRGRKINEISLMHPSCKTFPSFQFFYSLFFRWMSNCFSDASSQFSTWLKSCRKSPKLFTQSPRYKKSPFSLIHCLNRVCSYTQFVSTALTGARLMIVAVANAKKPHTENSWLFKTTFFSPFALFEFR